MHFSKLFLTAAAALAFGPATVYGYAVAGASVRFYEFCKHNETPGDHPKDTAPIILHENKCEQVKAPFPPLGFYSVNGRPFNDDARWHCDGIKAYQNHDCTGEPDFEVPFRNPDETALGTCQPKIIGVLSLRLDCREH